MKTMDLARVVLWWIVYVPVLSLLLGLGFWQLQRAEDKAGVQRGLALPMAAEVRSTSHLDTLPLLTEVRLEGEYLPGYDWLLDNQIFKGRFGYRVFTPFCDAAGCVVVDRGWIPGDLDRRELPQVDRPEGRVTIAGRISEPQSNVLLTDNEPSDRWPRRVQFLRVEDVAAVVPVLSSARVAHLGEGQPGVLEPLWKPVVMGPEKHRGYAVQWFTLAAAFTLLMIWMGLRNRFRSKDTVEF